MNLRNLRIGYSTYRLNSKVVARTFCVTITEWNMIHTHWKGKLHQQCKDKARNIQAWIVKGRFCFCRSMTSYFKCSQQIMTSNQKTETCCETYITSNTKCCCQLKSASCSLTQIVVICSERKMCHFYRAGGILGQNKHNLRKRKKIVLL